MSTETKLVLRQLILGAYLGIVAMSADAQAFRLDDVIATSDDVARIRIVHADVGGTKVEGKPAPTIVYKGNVVDSFKGELMVSEFISFSGYMQLKAGSEYLIFLVNEPDNPTATKSSEACAQDTNPNSARGFRFSSPVYFEIVNEEVAGPHSTPLLYAVVDTMKLELPIELHPKTRFYRFCQDPDDILKNPVDESECPIVSAHTFLEWDDLVEYLRVGVMPTN